MQKTFIGVRDVDEETFRKFKIIAMQKRIKIGDALTKAMKNLLEQKENYETPDINNLLKMKPVKIGKKVKWSEQIDEILYGFEK